MYEKTIMFLNTFKNELLLSVLFVFPLLPINYIGFLGVFISLILIGLNYRNKNLSHKREVFISILFFIFLVFTVSYSQNFPKGISAVFKLILIGVFPISIIGFSKIKSSRIDLILAFFIVVNIFLCIYVFNLAIEILSFKKMLFLNEASILEKIKVFIEIPYHIPFNWSSTEHEIVLFFHKAYMSMSLCLGAFISLYLMIFKKSVLLTKLALFSIYLLFVFFVFYMNSIPNIISLVIGTLVFIFCRIKLWKALIILSIGVISIFFIIKSDGIKLYTEKILDRIDEDYRVDIWKCGLEIVENDKFFGIGLGDNKDELFHCYSSKSKEIYEILYQEKYNLHNQYLNFYVSGGIFCLVLFLALIFNNLKTSFVTRDYLFLTFIILISVNFVFENMLDRVYGIYFFSFFNSFFVKRNLIINTA
ncbi:O-antigen ligase family protein [uncultured Algibacter sp.]|uniref:O-antigen ligase family protein n=1 Tax=uncultured Algibacter sp. TaxID=298659 RepID=UPI0032168370